MSTISSLNVMSAQIRPTFCLEQPRLMTARTKQEYLDFLIELAPFSVNYGLNKDTIGSVLSDEKFKNQFCKVYDLSCWERVVEKARSLNLIPEKSNSWTTAAKVASALLAFGGICFLYNLSKPKIIGDFENWHDPELHNGLEKLCEKAVREYCVERGGTKLCMKDYLSPDWKPEVNVEYGDTFVCPVNFAEEHRNLISQDFTKAGFIHNFESPETNISSEFDNLVSKSFPILFEKHFEKWTGGDNTLIKFKSHVTPFSRNAA